MSISRALPVVALAAAAIAVGIFFYVTDASAYLGRQASTCNNCHVMDAAYENWFRGGHAQETECVDCHLPHDNPADYYFEKGLTGIRDVYVFGTGTTPLLIRAKPGTQKIIQTNCLRCHAATVDNLFMSPQPFDRPCWDCHRGVAHGSRGISIAPYQEAVFYPVK